MSRSRFPLPTPLLALVLIGGLGISVARAATHEVVQSGLAFDPAALEIAAGDTVHWTWSTGTHTVTSGTPCTADGLFNAPLDSSNPEFSFTFNDPGIYDYFCNFHCAFGMTAVVTVTTPTGVPDSAAPVRTVSAFPNPFVAATNISFALDEAAPVRIEIFDASGRLATVLRDEPAGAGPVRIRWDGTRADGSAASSGIYYGRIVSGGHVQTVHLVKVD